MRTLAASAVERAPEFARNLGWMKGGRMVRPGLLSLGFCVLLTTSVWAQLASQTALVGTVTDSDGLAVPGAQVTAVNTGTRDTYEATTNAEGYYNIQFVRTAR